MTAVNGTPAAPPDKPPAPPGETEDEAIAPQVNQDVLAAAPPPAQSLAIQAPRLPEKPAAGMGRLRIDVSGTRKWCTFPDDRVVKPPPAGPEGPATRNPVYTFGYMFTVAAVNRANPAETLLLFESPTIRTAVLRQAGKVGRAQAPPSNRGPVIGEVPEHIQMKEKKQDPSAMVPFWQEEYRCTSLPESFDFDLAPGTYDLYLAFDILLRSGNWAHRTIAYETDVTIGDGDTTRLQGVSNMKAGGRRELELSGPSSSSASGAP
ncbi:MAG TPA: hypothetical protein VFQ07_04100 [Candidatus Polarisedimenticolia bacterium]|nr:hypothetical protein [Candidatus Polarisedimenticolia bacterium]